MKIGVVVPQGFSGEYDGWEAQDAWARTVSVALQAERLGFDSIWLFDHLHTAPEPIDDITFESFTSLAALASLTTRVRLGILVACAGYRNPALMAKMISTMDAISAGRMELGIGAGWKEDEWVAYGYGFPSIRQRMDILADSLQVVTRMLLPGRASYDGKHASVHEAINMPVGLQLPRIPIMVGGNGPNSTWRLAVQFADELNLNGTSPNETQDAIKLIRSRCQEAGRDPASLRVSVHISWHDANESGKSRVKSLREYSKLGIDRVMALIQPSAYTDDALNLLAIDARAAGLEIEV